LSDELDLVTPCVPHAGDGNLHHLPLVDPDDDMVTRAMELNDEVVSAAIEMGATTTGEHGVGIGKRKFMQQEHSIAVDATREVKKVFDAKGILNPGKVLPDE
jgi:D-lactate dehydrogenase (cytochrome)